MTDEPVESTNEQGEPTADVCESTAVVPDGSDGASSLVYEPHAVEAKPGVVEIRAQRENPDIIPWGFWGGVLTMLVAGYILFSGALTGPSARFSIVNVLVAAGLGIAGLVLYRLGRRSTLEEILLCEIEVENRILSWPARGGEVPVAVALDDIRQIGFGIVDAPVGEKNVDTRLEAATVWVLDDRDRRLPVVKASTSKDQTHRIARMLSDAIGISVDYVGTGVSEWAERTPLPH